MIDDQNMSYLSGFALLDWVPPPLWNGTMWQIGVHVGVCSGLCVFWGVLYVEGVTVLAWLHLGVYESVSVISVCSGLSVCAPGTSVRLWVDVLGEELGAWVCLSPCWALLCGGIRRAGPGAVPLSVCACICGQGARGPPACCPSVLWREAASVRVECGVGLFPPTVSGGGVAAGWAAPATPGPGHAEELSTWQT